VAQASAAHSRIEIMIARVDDLGANRLMAHPGEEKGRKV
jgi:hypothetical protein